LEQQVADRTSELVLQNLALQQARSILMGLPVGIMAIDNAGQIVHVNMEALEMVRLSMDEVLFKGYSQIVSTEICTDIRSLFNGGKTFCTSFTEGTARYQARGKLLELDAATLAVVLFDRCC
jgi:signal transduction histidine kinase